MKKLLALILSVSVLLCLASCASGDDSAADQGSADGDTNASAAASETEEKGMLKPYTEPEVDNIKIMLLGDSLTQGTAGSSGYRSYLYDMLKKDGYDFNFVGPWVIEPAFMPAGNRNHAGVGGYRMSGIKNDMNTFMSIDCDVIVMMIGTNDMNSDSAEGLTAQYEELVNMITKSKPEVRLFCASAPPTSFASGSYTQKHIDFNKGVKGICEKKTKEGFHVTWVDMSPESSKITNEDLNPEDHVHPVASGWEKFAITIYNTIKSTMTELSK